MRFVSKHNPTKAEMGASIRIDDQTELKSHSVLFCLSDEIFLLFFSYNLFHSMYSAILDYNILHIIDLTITINLY